MGKVVRRRAAQMPGMYSVAMSMSGVVSVESE